MKRLRSKAAHAAAGCLLLWDVGGGRQVGVFPILYGFRVGIGPMDVLVWDDVW